MSEEGFIALLIGCCLVWMLICGFVTRTINKNKGYEGGFWWGFFLEFIGIIVVACKPDNRGYVHTIENKSGKQTDNYSYEGALSALEKLSGKTKPTVNKEGWKCHNCGETNPFYVGTCGCGMTRQESEETDRAEKKQKEETIAAYLDLHRDVEETKNESADEMANLQKLKLYKELLDSGAITQEEFDNKKAKLLQ